MPFCCRNCSVLDGSLRTNFVCSVLRQLVLPTLTFHIIRKSWRKKKERTSWKMISFSQFLACPWGANVFGYHRIQFTIAYNNLVFWGRGVSISMINRQKPHGQDSDSAKQRITYCRNLKLTCLSQWQRPEPASEKDTINGIDDEKLTNRLVFCS